MNEILENDDLDENVIKEVYIDDYGYCIHITFTGGVSASTLIVIAKAFGDNDPNVYGVDKSTLNIVFRNEKYDCLISTAKTDD